MSLRRVIEGTPKFDGNSLCKSCSYSVHLRGEKLSEEIIQCQAIDSRITFKVTSCNNYKKSGGTPLPEMYNMAWKIATDKKGKTIGFASPKEFRDLVKNDKVSTTPIDDEEGYI